MISAHYTNCSLADALYHSKPHDLCLFILIFVLLYIHKEDFYMETNINEYILKLFNLENKNIDEFNVYHQFDGVHVYVRLSVCDHVCPVCGTVSSKTHSYTGKVITHSILNGTPCYINYKARRYICPECSKTFYEHNPFTTDGMKISLTTVYNVLNDLKKPNETFSAVAQRNNISPTAAAYIFDRHVNVSRRKLPECICIDEVYAFSSSKSDYVCVLLDFESQNVIDLLPSRRKYDLINYFTLIPREERLNVKVVCTDMWESYRVVTKIVFPNAVNSLDRFHLMQEFNRRLDRVRIDAMNRYKPSPNFRRINHSSNEIQEHYIKAKRYYVLKKFKWLLMKNDNKITDPNMEKKYNSVLDGYYNYYDLVELMTKADPQLEEALYLKDELNRFFDKSDIDNAKDNLNDLIREFKSSQISVMNDFGNTMVRWKNEIINSFIKVGAEKKRRVTNGIIENRNKIIKNIKHTSNGYRNWERFRNRVLYCLNDDVTFYMYPIPNKGENKK